MSLANQLQTLCEEHDLTSLSVHAYRRPDGTTFFGAYAQGGENQCGSNGLKGGSITDVLALAIADLRTRRGDVLIPVPELEEAA